MSTHRNGDFAKFIMHHIFSRKKCSNTAIFVKLSFAIIVGSRFIIVLDVRIEIIHIVIGLITAENIYSADIVWPRQKIPLLINLCIYLMNNEFWKELSAAIAKFLIRKDDYGWSANGNNMSRYRLQK